MDHWLSLCLGKQKPVFFLLLLSPSVTVKERLEWFLFSLFSLSLVALNTSLLPRREN